MENYFQTKMGELRQIYVESVDVSMNRINESGCPKT